VQLGFHRLCRRCDWVCVMAEGDMACLGLILAAQLSVDRLILLGGRSFLRVGKARQLRWMNAFARRNLALITAEILAVGLPEAALRTLATGLGFHSGGLLEIGDAAELWQKRETFLTAPFATLQRAVDCGK